MAIKHFGGIGQAIKAAGDLPNTPATSVNGARPPIGPPIEETEKFRLQHPDIRCMSISTVRDTRFRFPEANQVAPFFCPDI